MTGVRIAWALACGRVAVEKPELAHPGDASKGASVLLFSHESKKDLYELRVRFTSGRYRYRVFSPADRNGEGGGGVTVSDTTFTLLPTVECLERKYVFPAYLRRALACDAAHAHGRAACREKPFKAAGR